MPIPGKGPYSCKAAKDNEDGPIRGFARCVEHPDIAKTIGDPREEREAPGRRQLRVVQVSRWYHAFSPLAGSGCSSLGGAWQRQSR